MTIATEAEKSGSQAPCAITLPGRLEWWLDGQLVLAVIVIAFVERIQIAVLVGLRCRREQAVIEPFALALIATVMLRAYSPQGSG